MKKHYKKFMYGIGLVFLTVIFVACSNEPITIGETHPVGLFDVLLVYPISWLIDTIFKATNNGGIAITLTTLIIVFITAPLEIFSQVEMRKQQELQPKMKALQEKYPDNRTDPVQQQKYMQEYQLLARENGTSIIGMCAPMLLMLFVQMPILSGMYNAVRRLTGLNEASFTMFGVLYNYGQQDPGLPYVPYIGSWLRLFIFATFIAMFLSQYFALPKGQRKPSDNPQAMSMYMMNVLMILIFWNQPIALAIYWIVSNLARLFLRLTVVNAIVSKQHEKFKAKKREEKAKKYK